MIPLPNIVSILKAKILRQLLKRHSQKMEFIQKSQDLKKSEEWPAHLILLVLG